MINIFQFQRHQSVPNGRCISNGATCHQHPPGKILIACMAITTLFLGSLTGFTQKTWSGATSSDWNVSTNWIPVGVPTAAHNVVIPNTTNDPVILNTVDAEAKSITVYSSAAFTINTGGSLTLNGATDIGLYNSGTVNNSGIITIGNTISTGSRGIHNRGMFNNNTDGEIYIERFTYCAANNYYGSFTNMGTIVIQHTGAGGSYGLYNDRSTFINTTDGVIRIDGLIYGGLININHSLFTNTNEAEIYIGGTAPAGRWGLLNYRYCTFNNSAGGKITIDQSEVYGLCNQASSDFNNSATIIIGGEEAVGSYGLYNDDNSSFNNVANADLYIDRSTSYGILSRYSSLINDASNIIIGSEASVGAFAVRNYYSALYNLACSNLTIFSPLHNNSTFSNAGLLTAVTDLPHTNNSLINNGILAYPQGNPIPNVTNNDLIVLPISGECILPAALEKGGMLSFTAGNTWYKDVGLTMAAGTYDQTTNTFTATNLEEGTTTVYFPVTDDVNGCPQVVSIAINFDDITPPEISCRNITVDLPVSGSVYISPAEVLDSGTDNCSTVISESVSPNTFSCSNIGTNIVTLTTSDGNGNTATCTAVVTIDQYPFSTSLPTCQTVYWGFAPAACTIINSTVMGGVPPFSYVWSAGATTPDMEYCATSPANPDPFGLTVTDANGCTSVATPTALIQVVDIRCGKDLDKVMLCHKNNNTICISPDDVFSHLEHGDYLGACGAPDPCAGEAIAVPANQRTTTQESQVLVSPNPAQAEVQIRFKQEVAGETVIRLFDATGRLVRQKPIHTNIGLNSYRMDLAGLPDGIYILQLQIGKRREVIRLVLAND
ncbi:MAG: T9SS type A sorting domain-containing protein [Bacteroidetes bacterium]|nr:MAG: T9SS type A sorting domain-containing protein [Bacteroidota bacterium]